MIHSPFPDVEIPDVSFTDFVLAGAAGLGGKPAFIDAASGRTLSYAQLAESVRAAAAGLAGRGFGKGDVFAHYAPNMPEYAVAFHAVATAGGVNTTASPPRPPSRDELRRVTGWLVPGGGSTSRSRREHQHGCTEGDDARSCDRCYGRPRA
jgi:hypothetical protein